MSVSSQTWLLWPPHTPLLEDWENTAAYSTWLFLATIPRTHDEHGAPVPELQIELTVVQTHTKTQRLFKKTLSFTKCSVPTALSEYSWQYQAWFHCPITWFYLPLSLHSHLCLFITWPLPLKLFICIRLHFHYITASYILSI